MNKTRTSNFLLQCLISILLLTCWQNSANAQPGAIDASFNPTDLGFGSGDGANGDVTTFALQPDGKTLIGGEFTSYNGSSIGFINRMNADGTVDASFTAGTGADFLVYTIAIQPDGKILIGGEFTNYDGNIANYITRLNADGTKDASFNGTGANGSVYTIAIQPDGKILIGGQFTTYNGSTANRITRLNADGTLDAGFTGTGANNTVNTIAMQPDGKILAGGGFTTYNGSAANRITRLNADGTLDASFNTGTGANSTVNTIALQPDGKILIGGNITTYNGSTANRITRLNADGTLDAGFTGTGANRIVFAIAPQPDGKILIGGLFTTYNGSAANYMTRLNADGTLDAGFSGFGPNNRVRAIAMQPNGKILVGGRFTTYNGVITNRITRLNADGTKDAFFNFATGANDFVRAIALQPDGKILIGGEFTTYHGSTSNHITRLNADGSKDVGFNFTTGANFRVFAIAPQPNGKILIGGQFTIYNGVAANYITRLNPDGTKDANFNNVGTGANNVVNTITLQPDGKILVGGDFTIYNGSTVNRITRLNADGTLDAGFNVGTGANNIVNTITVQPDGKILIGGWFTIYNGSTANFITRLNADGTLDAGFNAGTGANGTVNTIALQPDGKILIGGDFTTNNGSTANYITRLNADGTLDTGFNTGTGVDNNVRTIALQPDGKILIGGDFATYNGINVNRLTRLNADGTLDAGFNVGTGANNIVYTIALQPDGTILIGGEFTGYNGTGRNRVARVLGTASTLPLQLLSFTGSKQYGNNQLHWHTADEVNTNVFVLEKSNDGRSFNTVATLRAVGTGANTYNYTDALSIAEVTYYRLKMVDNDGSFKYSAIVRLSNTPQSSNSIYPNPVTDVFTIQLSNNKLLHTQVKLVDVTGKTIQLITINAATQTANAASLPKGIYMLQFADGAALKLLKN